MSIKNCQAIQKSYIDRKSNARFTLGSESDVMVCDTYDFFRSTGGRGFQITNAVFRLERFTEVPELTYLGKHFPCVNAN